MNIFRFIIAGFFMLMLASCVSDFGAPGPVQGEFSRALSAQYTMLADDGNAAHFRDKAAEAQAGTMPLPDDPAQSDIPRDQKEQLDAARSELVQSLQAGSWIDSAGAAATAQVSYDCWLAQAAVKPAAAPPALPVKDCHGAFLTAMQGVRQPLPQTASYAVDFPLHSIQLGPMQQALLAQIAGPLRNRDGWSAVLTGHADPAETTADDRNIAIRRGMAIRNALRQLGIEPSSIILSTGGADQDVAARADINVMPQSQVSAFPLQGPQNALPENFGNAAPVF